MDATTRKAAATALLETLGQPTTSDEIVLVEILKHVAEGTDEVQKAAVISPPQPLPGEVKKTDDELQIVWSEVYVPWVPDTQGDFMRPDEIRKMAHKFLTKGHQHAIDQNHDQVDDRYTHSVVESFIARDGDPVFVPGAWVVGVHIPDADTWAAVKSGEFNGFSMDAVCKKQVKVVEIEVDPMVEGLTNEISGHKHSFVVRFNESGEFLGGQTNEVDGHSHAIRRATVTEKAEGHVHRFSVVGEADAVA